jgi:2-dehydro-3-deoxyphosphogalactonate aldolase
MTSFGSWLRKSPLIAILRGVQPHEVQEIAAALIDAGILIIEVPLNSPEPFESIRRLASTFGSKALVGAGTVLRPEDADAVHAAGGALVVMPHADAAVVARSKQLGMIAVPGFLTPTEAFHMIGLGADGLKLFPAEAASPKVLRSLRAALPRTMPIVPVGGIDSAGIAGWLEAGADGFGIGSALYKPGLDSRAVAAHAGALTTSLLAARKSARP